MFQGKLCFYGVEDYSVRDTSGGGVGGEVSLTLDELSCVSSRTYRVISVEQQPEGVIGGNCLEKQCQKKRHLAIYQIFFF